MYSKWNLHVQFKIWMEIMSKCITVFEAAKACTDNSRFALCKKVFTEVLKEILHSSLYEYVLEEQQMYMKTQRIKHICYRQGGDQ